MLLAASPAVPADEIRRSRDAEGRPKITIEGTPEEASTEDDRVKDRLSVEASLSRRELLGALEAKSARLQQIRAQVEEIESEAVTLHAQSLPTEPGEVQQAIDSERRAFLALRVYEEEKRKRLARLRADERQVLREILDVWDSFRQLDARVVETFGGTPTWWQRQLKCNGCPTEEDAREQLLRSSEK